MRLSYLSIAFFGVLCLPAVTHAQPRTFAVEWSSPQKTIEITGEAITVTTREYKYDNSPSATPTSVRTAKKRSKITADQASALRALFDRLGFWKLQPFYGAPEGERHYPYWIKARIGHRSKTVTYRSNPTFEPPPESFKRLETQISNLADSIKDWVEVK